MSTKRVLLYSDGQGWIVDRISKKMREICGNYGIDIDIRYYTREDTSKFVEYSSIYDLIHFNNWDIESWRGHILKAKCPVLISVRSHRFPRYVEEFLNTAPVHTHVINKDLLKDFPKATYIPDGIFTEGLPVNRAFTVGMVFQNCSDYNREYKGYPIVKEACEKLKVDLVVAGGEVDAGNMREFYDSCDLIVVASEAEGHNTIALECAAMNKPVLTTNVGLAKELNLHRFERNVPSLVHEMQKFYTSPQVAQYNWDLVCKNFAGLYRRIISEA